MKIKTWITVEYFHKLSLESIYRINPSVSCQSKIRMTALRCEQFQQQIKISRSLLSPSAEKSGKFQFAVEITPSRNLSHHH